MVHPPQTCLIKATGWAHPGLVIQIHLFGLYAGNEEKHGTLVLIDLVLYIMKWILVNNHCPCPALKEQRAVLINFC